MRLLPTPITPPAVEPVTLADCRGDARIDHDAFDGLLPTYIAAARQACEHETGLKLITQTCRAELTDWPTDDDVIGLSPATAATITYWTGSIWATLAAGLHQLDQTAGGCVILPTVGAVWPALGERNGPRVRVDVTCGFGPAPDDVPASLRLWIRAQVAATVRDPASFITGTIVAINPQMQGLLDPHRVYVRR